MKIYTHSPVVEYHQVGKMKYQPKLYFSCTSTCLYQAQEVTPYSE